MTWVTPGRIHARPVILMCGLAPAAPPELFFANRRAEEEK